MDLSKKEDRKAWTIPQLMMKQVVGCCEQSSKHNIQITHKIHFTVYDVLESHFSHQHDSVAIAAVFRVKLLQE
jgi:hypothetical protein